MASICDVLPAAAGLLGVGNAADLPDPVDLLGRVGSQRQVVVVLVDGLGTRLFPQLAGHAPYLTSLAGDALQLRSTFPSTTPTSLVSLGTGVQPGEHGVLGFVVKLPGSRRLLTHVRWRDDPPPARWQPVPTWFQRLAAMGVDSSVVLPAPFRVAGLTAAAYRGARFVPAASTSLDPDAVAAELAAGTRLVLGYTDVVDAAAHKFGIASSQWSAAAREVDGLLERIAADLPPGAALLVTADHGGLDVPPDTRIDVDADPALADGVDVLAGEPRVRYLHTVPGARDDVAAAWRDVLADRADVRTREQAIDAGWFGPVRPDHAERIGDVVVVCRDTWVVVSSRRDPPEVLELIGFHGALTDAETAIPLLTAFS